MLPHYICSTCGETHDGLPTDWGFRLPDVIWEMPPQRRKEEARFNDDLCQYGERYFIRGVLCVPFRETENDFGWGVWAEVDETVFERYLRLYEADGSSEPPHAGKLANDLPAYPQSLNTPIRIQFGDKNKRPVFTLRQEDHGALAVEQRTGMSEARYHELLEVLPKSKESGQDRSTLCISCTHVVDDGDTVLLVSRSGGDWILLCGHTDHSKDEDTEALRLIPWRHLVERDPSLEGIISSLEIDHSAERNAAGEEWRIFFDPDTDD